MKLIEVKSYQIEVDFKMRSVFLNHKESKAEVDLN